MRGTASRLLFLIAASVILVPDEGRGQANLLQSLVYVSESDGADMPACGSMKRPCQTFAYSLGRVAAHGRIVVLNSGEYGLATITKSVTIEAPPGVNALVQVSPPGGAGSVWRGTGIDIAAGQGDKVTLRGIKIAIYPPPPPGGQGITFRSGSELYVEQCVIEGANAGIVVFNTNFGATMTAYIRNTVVTGGGTGIVVVRDNPSLVRVQIEDSAMQGNFSGLGVHDGAAVTVKNSAIVDNRRSGVEAGSSNPSPTRTTQLMLESVLISGNNLDGLFVSNANTTVRVSNSTITDNGVGISGFFGPSVSVLSRGNNTLEANTINGSFTGTYLAK